MPVMVLRESRKPWFAETSLIDTGSFQSAGGTVLADIDVGASACIAVGDFAEAGVGKSSIDGVKIGGKVRSR